VDFIGNEGPNYNAAAGPVELLDLSPDDFQTPIASPISSLITASD